MQHLRTSEARALMMRNAAMELVMKNARTSCVFFGFWFGAARLSGSTSLAALRILALGGWECTTVGALALFAGTCLLVTCVRVVGRRGSSSYLRRVRRGCGRSSARQRRKDDQRKSSRAVVVRAASRLSVSRLLRRQVLRPITGQLLLAAVVLWTPAVRLQIQIRSCPRLGLVRCLETACRMMRWQQLVHTRRR